MNESSLRQTLEQLHAELEKTECVNDEDCERLRDLMQHIQSILEHSEMSKAPRYNSLSGRLHQAIKQFEEAHPDLVLAIGRVLDHLAQV